MYAEDRSVLINSMQIQWLIVGELVPMQCPSCSIFLNTLFPMDITIIEDV